MKRLTFVVVLMALALQMHAFDRTLRVDYIFSGNCSRSEVSLLKMSVTDGWYGRTTNMDKVPVKGNGDIRMKDVDSGETIYAMSFSTLFQEWQATPEAKTTVKAFENTFLLPMPLKKAVVEVSLFDLRGEKVCTYSHVVDPQDILIEKREVNDVERRYIHYSGDPSQCIDVVILAEGYCKDEMELFYQDAAAAADAIFSHEPFSSEKDRFNILAVAPESFDSGVSIPREGVWKDTAVKSSFDTFYVERYLTTLSIFGLHDLLDGMPYEHIIILANTGTYGGGGIYNSYTLTTAHHPMFKPVVVHEFGHSFGALADEYAYAGEEDPYYFSDVEPWEQNITTKADFSSKWQDMMDARVKGVDLFEGAGYQPKGVWRPAKDCRMRTNKAEEFCPVCQRAIERMIEFYR